MIYIAVINIFPPLTIIGDNMLDNFLKWGQKRIAEIPVDVKIGLISIENRAVEITKLEDRLKKFTDKMNYLTVCKEKLAAARIEKNTVQAMEIGQE